MTNEHPVVEIIKKYALDIPLPPIVRSNFNRIVACADKNLGTHTMRCMDCDTQHVRPNTCKTLHCPNCAQARRQEWIKKRQGETVNCSYFHNVFTIPHQFNKLFQNNFKIMANIFFEAVATTLKTFAENPREKKGGQPGFILFLHTWDQKLLLHFHIHAVIAGGWLDENKEWIDGTRGNSGKYLFPVQALQKFFKGQFITSVGKAIQSPEFNWTEPMNFYQFIGLLPKDWVVYSEKTIYSPASVIKYLGAYTHKMGLAKSKLHYNGQTVEIKAQNRKTKDYYTVTLSATEFLRRFSTHIFCDSVQRVRYYGFLGNATKKNSTVDRKANRKAA